MNKRLHAVFKGHVQGVGFRFTVRSLARELSLPGWVRNCPDGRVEMLVEGEEGVLIDLVARIEDEFREYIDGKETEWAAATGEFADFGIRM